MGNETVLGVAAVRPSADAVEVRNASPPVAASYRSVTPVHVNALVAEADAAAAITAPFAATFRLRVPPFDAPVLDVANVLDLPVSLYMSIAQRKAVPPVKLTTTSPVVPVGTGARQISMRVYPLAVFAVRTSSVAEIPPTVRDETVIDVPPVRD